MGRPHGERRQDACKRPSGGGAGVSLATWQYSRRAPPTQSAAAVQAQYAAACYVVTRVAGAAGRRSHDRGPDGAAGRRDPYADRDPAVKRTAAVATWKDWLDAVDELALAPAGAKVDLASNLLLEYGATTDRATLTRRAAARTVYHALAARSETGWCRRRSGARWRVGLRARR